jgi:hypothetical protein
MTSQPEPQPGLLGFLTVEQTGDERGYVGALMITDANGYPLEFRATTSVKPSAVQRVLYGGSLESFVSIELCAKKLLKECRRSPVVVLTPDKMFLRIPTDDSPCPVVFIRRAGEVVKAASPGDETPAVHGNVEPKSSPFEAIVYEAYVDPEAQTRMARLLETCLEQFDLIEAFERMRAALSILAQEDPRYG